MVEGKNLVYRANEYSYSLKFFYTISTFGRNIYNDKITLKEADEYQSCLFVEIINFKSKINMKNLEKFLQKNILKNLYALFDGRERVLNVFERKIFLT